MPKWCSAGTCKNHHLMRDENGKTKYSFFKFPSHSKDTARRALWAKACNRLTEGTNKPWEPNPNVTHVYICSSHFITGTNFNLLCEIYLGMNKRNNLAKFLI